MQNFQQNAKMSNFVRLAVICFCLVQITLCSGQSSQKSNPDSLTHYDVASIRPANPDERGVSIGGGGTNSFIAKNTSIALLLVNTYNLREEAISGIPASLNSKRFDVVAKLVDATPQELENLSGEQQRKMLENILRDRFALKAHMSTKVAQVYVLTQAKGRAKIKPSSVLNKPTGGMAPGTITVSNGHLKAHAIPISSLIGSLTGAVQNNVIDDTNLQGVYDIDLTWNPSLSGEPFASGDAGYDAPSIFTALQEQLGLKLVAAKRPVPILIVDHVEMPTPN